MGCLILRKWIVVDREPDGLCVRHGPFDPVALMCREIDRVADSHADRLTLPIDLQDCCPANDKDPFRLRLVIPDPGGEEWPRDTIRSMRTLVPESSVVNSSQL